MKLSSDQVKKVAKLSNIQISEAEVDKYADQLSEILDYIDQLNQVDTKGVKPLFNVREESVTRADEVQDSLAQDEALQNAQNKRDGFFVTKGVFEDE